MKTNFQKIFIGLSLSLTFFLGVNFVNAQTIDVNSSDQCGTVSNYSSDGYSTNSNGGTSYTTDNQVLKWYINKTVAITEAAAGNTHAVGVCETSYTNGANAKHEGWKKDLCSANIESLISHQESLFNAFKSVKNLNLDWGFLGYIKVWNLQQLMSGANCHKNRDCKLGVNTISNFLFCNVCSAINSGWTELASISPNKTCDTGYGLTENQLCCQPLVCEAPVIKINGDESFDKYGSDSLHIDIDYSSSVAGTLSPGNISIEGGTMNGEKQIGSDTITFALMPDEDKNEIKIIINGVTLNGVECPDAEKTIYRDIECQLTKDRQECSNSGGFDINNGATFTGFQQLLGQECVKGGVSIPFCPDTCTTWSVGTSCEGAYGSGWFDDGNDCCKTCGPNEKREGTGCVCIKTSADCEKAGDRLNLKTCKCECDPNQRCCGILLNTVVPFIGDCIEITSQNDPGSSSDPNTSTLNQLNAFPFLMMGLSKILVTVILIFSFLIVIAAGLMMTTGVYSESNYKKGMEWIQKIVIALILLGSSGLILKLINPSFFGG